MVDFGKDENLISDSGTCILLPTFWVISSYEGFFLIFRNCLFLNILMQLTELCKGNEGEGAGVLTESGDFSKP